MVPLDQLVPKKLGWYKVLQIILQIEVEGPNLTSVSIDEWYSSGLYNFVTRLSTQDGVDRLTKHWPNGDQYF